MEENHKKTAMGRSAQLALGGSGMAICTGLVIYASLHGNASSTVPFVIFVGAPAARTFFKALARDGEGKSNPKKGSIEDILRHNKENKSEPKPGSIEDILRQNEEKQKKRGR